jgi:hypothetical protein
MQRLRQIGLASQAVFCPDQIEKLVRVHGFLFASPVTGRGSSSFMLSIIMY